MCTNIRSHEIAFHHFLDKTFRGGRCDNRITLKTVRIEFNNVSGSVSFSRNRKLQQ